MNYFEAKLYLFYDTIQILTSGIVDCFYHYQDYQSHQAVDETEQYPRVISETWQLHFPLERKMMIKLVPDTFNTININEQHETKQKYR